VSPLAWVLIAAGVALVALAVCKLREAGRTLDAILAEARREDPE
jgi:Sec-independent protein translocase protein TatA